jgi:ABC-type multidrug transport system ATPase subunit
LGLDPRHPAERPGAVVDAVDVAKPIDRALDRYGGEQRRRLEIARGRRSLRPVPFLNEPTVGFDPRFDQSSRTSWPAFQRETA